MRYKYACTIKYAVINVKSDNNGHVSHFITTQQQK